MAKNEKIEKLIENHWEYVRGILVAHHASEEVMRASEYHYKSAFAHGWKHCEEDHGLEDVP